MGIAARAGKKNVTFTAWLEPKKKGDDRQFFNESTDYLGIRCQLYEVALSRVMQLSGLKVAEEIESDRTNYRYWLTECGQVIGMHRIPRHL